MDKVEKLIDFEVKVHFAISGVEFNLTTFSAVPMELLESREGIEYATEIIFRLAPIAIRERIEAWRGIDNSPQAMYERESREA